MCTLWLDATEGSKLCHICCLNTFFSSPGLPFLSQQCYKNSAYAPCLSSWSKRAMTWCCLSRGKAFRGNHQGSWQVWPWFHIHVSTSICTPQEPGENAGNFNLSDAKAYRVCSTKCYMWGGAETGGIWRPELELIPNLEETKKLLEQWDWVLLSFSSSWKKELQKTAVGLLV